MHRKEDVQPQHRELALFLSTYIPVFLAGMYDIFSKNNEIAEQRDFLLLCFETSVHAAIYNENYQTRLGFGREVGLAILNKIEAGRVELHLGSTEDDVVAASEKVWEMLGGKQIALHSDFRESKGQISGARLAHAGEVFFHEFAFSDIRRRQHVPPLCISWSILNVVTQALETGLFKRIQVRSHPVLGSLLSTETFEEHSADVWMTLLQYLHQNPDERLVGN